MKPIRHAAPVALAAMLASTVPIHAAPADPRGGEPAFRALYKELLESVSTSSL